MGESASILIPFSFQKVPKKTQKISWTVKEQGIEEGPLLWDCSLCEEDGPPREEVRRGSLARA